MLRHPWYSTKICYTYTCSTVVDGNVVSDVVVVGW